MRIPNKPDAAPPARARLEGGFGGPNYAGAAVISPGGALAFASGSPVSDWDADRAFLLHKRTQVRIVHIAHRPWACNWGLGMF